MVQGYTNYISELRKPGKDAIVEKLGELARHKVRDSKEPRHNSSEGIMGTYKQGPITCDVIGAL